MADIDDVAHKIADEIYKRIEDDHVKDGLFTWIDLALLALALVCMALIPATAAPMTLLPNVGVKGYQLANRWRKNRK